MERVQPHFVYTFNLILTKPILELLLVFYCKHAIELRPFIDVRILFLINILRTKGYVVVVLGFYVPPTAKGPRFKV